LSFYVTSSTRQKRRGVKKDYALFFPSPTFVSVRFLCENYNPKDFLNPKT